MIHVSSRAPLEARGGHRFGVDSRGLLASPHAVKEGAIEHWLAQLLVDMVVRLTGPLTEGLTGLCSHGIFGYVFLEIVGTPAARKQL